MNLTEAFFCPWCAMAQPARIARAETGCTELECSTCHRRWTVKDDHPGDAFAFHPSDVDAAFDNDLEPLFP